MTAASRGIVRGIERVYTAPAAADTASPLLGSSYAPYPDRLHALITVAVEEHEFAYVEEALRASRNGQPSRELRQALSRQYQREIGAFFSGTDLSQRAASAIGPLPSTGQILDPACGAGDLLLAVSESLPVRTDVSSTLALWGDRLAGYDVHPQFVRTAKLRLLLAAMDRCKQLDGVVPDVERVFPRIVERNLFDRPTTLQEASCLIANPPFGNMAAPPDCRWASGSVAKAALFVEECLVQARPGTRIVFILPDVLRSGSRYARWRARVEQLASVDNVDVFGRFDANTDVDVFLLAATANAPGQTAGAKAQWVPVPVGAAPRLADHFLVAVGPVVPHRHQECGPSYPFLRARDLPWWGEVEADRWPTRRFDGTTFQPPFVAVRRTSSPSDSARAIGTLVVGQKPVAVENHLLVLRPKDGERQSCEELLSVLKKEETKTWLNRRIRCRHLTVSSLQDLPYRTGE
jgi:hypothetical protein